MMRTINSFMGKPFFNAGNLETAFKELLQARGLDKNALFRGAADSSCKV